MTFEKVGYEKTIQHNTINNNNGNIDAKKQVQKLLSHEVIHFTL